MSEDFGLLFRSTFTGSMVGTSPTVFAVWAYVVAHGYGGQVDLNPRLLAATFGTSTADVEAAIRFHCAPDPDSRTDTDEGRRLRHLGGVAYEVINHAVYRNRRALEERKAYNRAAQRASRERRRGTTEVPIFDMSKTETTTADPLVLVSVSSPSGSDPEGVQGEGDHAPPEQDDHPTAEAGTGAAAPSPDDATKAVQESRPHGVPSAAAAPTHLAEVLQVKLGDWVIPPELYDEAEREHGIGRDELEHRVDAIRERPIPGGRYGLAGLTTYVRGLLTEWASWDPPKPKGVRKARSPARASPKGLPWVDASHAAQATALGAKLSELARAFAHEHDPHLMRVDDARAAFTRYLARSAPADVAA